MLKRLAASEQLSIEAILRNVEADLTTGGLTECSEVTRTTATKQQVSPRASQTNADSTVVPQASVWQPSPDLIGTKTIGRDPRFTKGGKNPGASTIARWVDRSKADGNPVVITKSPDSGENHYPLDWVLDQIKKWHPRQ